MEFVSSQSIIMICARTGLDLVDISPYCDRFATPDIPRDKLIINNVGVNRKRFIFWFSAIFQNILKYWDNSKRGRVVLKKYAFFKCSNKSDTIEWNVIPWALERNARP